MQSQPQPLAISLMKFYGKLIMIGLSMSGLAGVVWAVVLAIRGQDVSLARVSTGVFWFGVLTLGWVAISFTTRSQLLGQADALRSPVMPRFSHRVQAQEGRDRFAWYAGSTGLIAIAVSILLAYL